MTVKELKEKLNMCDDCDEVFVAIGENDGLDIDFIEYETCRIFIIAKEEEY